VEVNGLHVNVKNIPGKKITPGVNERILLSSVKSELSRPTVKHYTLSKEGQIVFGSPLTEYQHYIIQGCVTQNDPNGSLLHQDTAWFVPCNTPWGGETARKHSLHHAGEGEVRVLSILYETPRPAFRWAKSRSRNLHEVPQPHSARRLVSYIQIFKEEEHASMGALRMHAMDVQTNPPGVGLPDHKNPEEVMYVLMGRGVAFSDGESHEISSGSMVYTPEGAVHGIRSVEETLVYLVVEFVNQARMWSERGNRAE
jgi:quercetin dioxygenase-like cupin family protein